MADPAKNLNAILVGTIEFAFCEGATSAADAKLKGYRDIGNIIASTPGVENTKVEHFGSYRGKRRKDKTITTESKLEFTVRCDEWNKEVMKYIFGAGDGTNHTQSALSAAAGEALAFTASVPSDKNKWYDVRDSSGNRVRKITTLTFSTLTEGTDFEVDTLLGRVRFLTQRTATVTPTITAPAITSADDDYFEGLKPMDNLTRTGFGRLVCYDQNDKNKVAWDYVDFSCEVSIESAGEIDGQNPTEGTLKVVVTDTVGNLLVRKANLP